MPGNTLTLLLELNSDGCTYCSETALLAFSDANVAALVCEELNSQQATPFRSFSVKKIEVSVAKDETSVAGLVAALIAKHKFEEI